MTCSMVTQLVSDREGMNSYSLAPDLTPLTTWWASFLILYVLRLPVDSPGYFTDASVRDMFEASFFLSVPLTLPLPLPDLSSWTQPLCFPYVCLCAFLSSCQ